MVSSAHQQLLRQLPSVSDLLRAPEAVAWLKEQPQGLVSACLRDAVGSIREQILNDEGGRCGAVHVQAEYVLKLAGELLRERTWPHLRRAINATGIILHTGLGRAVWARSVVESMIPELQGYATLAIDPQSGERIERDPHIEYVLSELTGAEAATVVNNNAGATLIVLAAPAAGKEAVVSRGQLIEIGGSFRLPDVMGQSGAKLVEVGTTNRTHLRDYARAIGSETAMLLKVHPSNYRVVGFTAEVGLAEMVQLGHERGLVVADDLAAGALVDLAAYGLPHEPMVRESIAAGADVVLFSGDKLIGGPQAGIIVGKKACIEKIRKHPLMRALRVDKTCLMALERTLHLFRDPARLRYTHPTYRMLSTPMAELQARAEKLAEAIRVAAPAAEVAVGDGAGYLGSGSLPMEALPGRVVRVRGEMKAEELARRLRMGEPGVFGRIEEERVVLDVRTIAEEEVGEVAGAVGAALRENEE